ncbi:MAG: hypothetical protein AB2693_03830 [Candidatus Thiodiazotropha sp.]
MGQVRLAQSRLDFSWLDVAAREARALEQWDRDWIYRHVHGTDLPRRQSQRPSDPRPSHRGSLGRALPPRKDIHHRGESTTRLPESGDKVLPSRQDRQASTHPGPEGMASPSREVESSMVHSPTLSEEEALLKEDPREVIYLGDPVVNSGTTSKPTRQTSNLPSVPRIERKRSPSRRRRRGRHDQPNDSAKKPKFEMLVVPRESDDWRSPA